MIDSRIHRRKESSEFINHHSVADPRVLVPHSVKKAKLVVAFPRFVVCPPVDNKIASRTALFSQGRYAQNSWFAVCTWISFQATRDEPIGPRITHTDNVTPPGSTTNHGSAGMRRLSHRGLLGPRLSAKSGAKWIR